jgi:BirA family biotin operon repressor/biotin-[acetyl-CoA-carboxylase] ligase
VTTVAETGSTNADLVAAARAGAPAGTVLVARHQTAGRGRLDRAWEAPPDAAVLLSILLRPGDDPAAVHRCTRAVGVAVVRAVGALAGVTATLKWPNDVLVGERKLAGVLAEGVWDGPHLAAVVVGAGINRAWPRPLPAHLDGTMVDLLEASGVEVDAASLVDAVLTGLDHLDGHPDELDAAYRGLLSTLGRDVRVELPAGEEVVGRAVDVDADGRLVVDVGGVRRTVAAGDVVHLRTAG